MDLADVITSSDEQIIEAKIRELNESGLAQIQVLTVEDMQGLTIEQASLAIAEKWQLGSAKADNGVLILVAKQERRIRIEVGQGLEGTLPDVIARRIVSDVIIPFFRQGIPSQGIVQGVDKVIASLQGDTQAMETFSRTKKISPFKGKEGILFLVVLLGIFTMNIFGRSSRRGFNRFGGGGFGGGFGGGGFGGGGGGGWSGGGGGFSGGGASDGW